MTAHDPPRSIAERAWGWLERERTQFELPQRGEDHVVLGALKPLNELTFVADVILRLRGPGDAWHGIARDTLDFCWSETDGGARLTDLLGRYPDRFDLTTLYASFARHGLSNQRLHELIAHLSRTRGVGALEILPWVALDIADSLRALGIASTRRVEELAERTWLYARPEPWTMSESAAYSLTHTVFHLTNFGIEPEGLPPDVVRYLEAWLPVWLEYYAGLGNFELLAELLIVDSCLERRSDTARGWETLRRAQHEKGLVPGLTYGAGQVVAGPQGPQSPRTDFTAHYHPTLVAMLAGVMASGPGTDGAAGHR